VEEVLESRIWGDLVPRLLSTPSDMGYGQCEYLSGRYIAANAKIRLEWREREHSSTSTSTTATILTSQPLTKGRSYPNIEPKLARQHNFAQWILLIEQTLEQLDHGEGSIWDIVTSEIKDPAAGSITKIGKSTDEGKKALI